MFNMQIIYNATQTHFKSSFNSFISLQNENNKLREHIRWADAILLMYDVTDRCSFNECSRLKFLINAHSRRNRRKSGSDVYTELSTNVPVAMVANKKDRHLDRMVLTKEGATRSVQLNCFSFHELSVKEDIDDVIDVIEDLYVAYRKSRKSRSLALTQSKPSLFTPEKLTKSQSQISSSSSFGGESSSDEEQQEYGQRGGTGGVVGGGTGGGAINGGGVGLGGAAGGSVVSLISKVKVRMNGYGVTSEEDSDRDELIKRSTSRRREALFSISSY